MTAFLDAQCPKCQRRIGWQGNLTDRPACPRCGHKPDLAALAKDQEKMDDFRELLREMRERLNSAFPFTQWGKARVAAGLSLRQAARVLRVEPQALCDVEQGREQPSQALTDRMAECYGG